MSGAGRLEHRAHRRRGFAGRSLEDLAEAADAFLDLIFLHAGVAEHQAAAARPGEEVVGDAVDADS